MPGLRRSLYSASTYLLWLYLPMRNSLLASLTCRVLEIAEVGLRVGRSSSRPKKLFMLFRRMFQNKILAPQGEQEKTVNNMRRQPLSSFRINNPAMRHVLLPDAKQQLKHPGWCVWVGAQRLDGQCIAVHSESTSLFFDSMWTNMLYQLACSLFSFKSERNSRALWKLLLDLAYLAVLPQTPALAYPSSATSCTVRLGKRFCQSELL